MFKKVLKRIFNSLGYELSNLKSIQNNETSKADLIASINKIIFILTHSDSRKNSPEIKKIFDCPLDKIIKSKSQLFQDLFVLSILSDKRDGFFVEFGATDGVTLSNTFLLEKNYDWTGILAEPGRIWEARLKKNRNCPVDTRCVWAKSGEVLTFYETEYAELSTIDEYADVDFFSKSRLSRKEYKVETISLNDLLDLYNAPSSIDYMSIDTEGSEYSILRSFDFSKRDISVITVEHNFSSNREKIFTILMENGYRRVLESISLFDDWYIRNDLIIKSCD